MASTLSSSPSFLDTLGSFIGIGSSSLLGFNTPSKAANPTIFNAIAQNLPKTPQAYASTSNASYGPTLQNNNLSTPSNTSNANTTNTNSAPTGDSEVTQLMKMLASGGLNPIQQEKLNQLMGQQSNAAQDAYNAENSRLNTAYNQTKENLLSQVGSLEGQRDRAVSDIELGLSGVQNQVGASKTNAQTNADTQIRQGGSIAKSTQQQNRNVLRALGIINSSAAGEMLSKPVNEFAQQRASIQQAVGQRLSELDDFLNQKTAEANSAKNGIISQFTDLYGKIQSDLRFNDSQRNDALQAAGAALNQRLSDIQTSLLNYQTQADLQKQNFLQGLAQISAYDNPSINTNSILSNILSNTGNSNTQNSVTASIYNDPTKKQQGLSGAYL